VAETPPDPHRAAPALRPPWPLLLASTSRYRRELLQRLGIAFEWEAPAVSEAALSGESPPQRAQRLALAKAHAVAARHPGAIAIGSDQVCAAEGEIFGKPATTGHQAQMLERLSGRIAQFHTAVAIVGIGGGAAHCAPVRLEHLDRTDCQFRRLDAAEIRRYVTAEPALDCAGGFKVEGLGIALLERVASEDPTALIGLPLIWVAAALRSLGA
jgi:septum formation protein